MNWLIFDVEISHYNKRFREKEIVWLILILWHIGTPNKYCVLCVFRYTNISKRMDK